MAGFTPPSVGLFAFDLARGWSLYAARVPYVSCGPAERPGAVVAGLALKHTAVEAVWEGVPVRRAPFPRTPKPRGLGVAAALLLAWAALAGVGLAGAPSAYPGGGAVGPGAVRAVPALRRRGGGFHRLRHAGAGPASRGAARGPRGGGGLTGD